MSGIVLVALVPAMNLVRFVGLEESPPGFHVDEAAGAVTIECLATEGRDANGARYPLFSDVGFGTPKPPPYLYLGLLWTKLFGFSIASFRAFSAAVGMATVSGLALLGRRLLDRRFALFVAVAASLSPWAFLSSRIGWEVPLAPCFVVWGTYFLLQGGRAPFALASGSVSPSRCTAIRRRSRRSRSPSPSCSGSPGRAVVSPGGACSSPAPHDPRPRTDVQPERTDRVASACGRARLALTCAANDLPTASGRPCY